jgi:hypothetical protein
VIYIYSSLQPRDGPTCSYRFIHYSVIVPMSLDIHLRET